MGTDIKLEIANLNKPHGRTNINWILVGSVLKKGNALSYNEEPNLEAKVLAVFDSGVGFITNYVQSFNETVLNKRQKVAGCNEEDEEDENIVWEILHGIISVLLLVENGDFIKVEANVIRTVLLIIEIMNVAFLLIEHFAFFREVVRQIYFIRNIVVMVTFKMGY